MTIMQQKRGTATEWASNSTIVLAEGEIGVEYDTGKIKVGDGTSAWSALAYIGAGLQNVVEDTTPQLGGDLDTNGHDITNLNALTFDTSPTGVPTTPGTMSWDPDMETAVLVLDGVNLQIGQEHVIRVKNNSGSVAIPNGTAVMFAGATGDTVKATPAVSTSSSEPNLLIGITTEEISADGFGFVTQFGFVNNVNTGGMTLGDLLYVDPATPGLLTTTKPTAPNWTFPVAAVTKVNSSSGRILVRTIPGDHLHDIVDVEITSPGDNEVLAYDSTSGTWINQTASEAGLSAVGHIHDDRYYTETETDDEISTAITALGLGTMSTQSSDDYAALAGATFTGTVVMSNVGVDINDTNSRVGRIIGSGDIMYIQGGADSADTAARVIIGRTASSGNISQLDLRADTTNILGKVEVAQKQNALVVSAYNSATADPNKFANNSRVIMTAAATGSSDPTTRPDGTDLQAGDVWISW